MRKPVKIGRSYSVVLSPDETRLAVLGRFVFVWDIQLGKKLFRCHPFAHPSDACYSPSGTFIAVKNTAGRIFVIDAHDGHTVADFENNADGEGSNLAYSGCGQFVVDGSWAGWLRVRNSTSGEIVFEKEFPREMIRAIHYDEPRQHWIVEHQPKTRPSENWAPPAYFSAWEWPFSHRQYTVLHCRIDLLCSSALSSDGKHLAVVHGVARGKTSSELKLYGVEDARLLCSVPVSVGGTGSALSWSPDGSLLASVQEK